MRDIKQAIFELAPQIAELLISGLLNSAQTSKNSSGDHQIPLDIMCDEIIEKKFLEIASISDIISEEKEGIVPCNVNWEYIVAYDPLDGSSIVDVNMTVGSIFAVYKKVGDQRVGTADLLSLQGQNLIAACYIVFGPRIELVWTDKNGTSFHRMWLDNLFHEVEIKQLKHQHNIISTWAPKLTSTSVHNNIVASFYQEEYKLRYAGWMVPDLHSIILKWGGIFSYPAFTDKPDGKLRKLFEVFPFAYVFESLWWQAIDSYWRRILDLKIEKNIHESTSCYIWSHYEIEKIKEML